MEIKIKNIEIKEFSEGGRSKVNMHILDTYTRSINTVNDWLDLIKDIRNSSVIVISNVANLTTHYAPNFSELFPDAEVDISGGCPETETKFVTVRATVIDDPNVVRHFRCFNPLYDYDLDYLIYEEDGEVKWLQCFTIKDGDHFKYVNFGAPIIRKKINNPDDFIEYVRSTELAEVEFEPDNGLPTYADEFLWFHGFIEAPEYDKQYL